MCTFAAAVADGTDVEHLVLFARLRSLNYFLLDGDLYLVHRIHRLVEKPLSRWLRAKLSSESALSLDPWTCDSRPRPSQPPPR